jgi:hypothetical protein
MTSTGSIEEYDAIVKQCRNLLVEKSKKYHGTPDILHTFRVSSSVARLEPCQTMIVRIVEKMLRCGTMIEQIQAGELDDAVSLAESILDTAADTWNYAIFLHMFLSEFVEIHKPPIGSNEWLKSNAQFENATIESIETAN